MKIGYFALLFLAISCAPKIKNFDLYEKQFMAKTAFLPSEEQIEGKNIKAVVFSFDENSDVAKQADVGRAIADDVENILSKNRLAKLIDRNAAKKLEKEIQLAEMNKTGAYKGPQVADYAISGSVSGAGFTAKYNAGSTYFDAKAKAFISIPPSYSYKSEVSGNLKIYELPSMTVLENLEFSGFASRKENVRQNGGFALGAIRVGGQQAAGASRDDNLVRQAANDAIVGIEEEIKNALAHRGYILEKRVYNGKSIFKITLGSEDGVKNGDKFDVIGQFESQNPITLKSEIERKILAQGAISDLIDPKSSWVVLDDEKRATKIRLGDSVKMKYKKSGLKSFARSVKKAVH